VNAAGEKSGDSIFNEDNLWPHSAQVVHEATYYGMVYIKVYIENDYECGDFAIMYEEDNDGTYLSPNELPRLTLPNLTSGQEIYPAGDVDYYRLEIQKGRMYNILWTSAGVMNGNFECDIKFTFDVMRDNSREDNVMVIENNIECAIPYAPGYYGVRYPFESAQKNIPADFNGWLFIKVEAKDELDIGTYGIWVEEVLPPPATP
jgi:hypothetical protein